MSAVDYIVVGLGNPGDKYKKTRHNSGFIILDLIAEKMNVNFSFNKFDALSANFLLDGKKIMLLKPQTYMNLSGKSVLGVMSFYKVKPENIILIFDDICLPVGKIRIRKKGSHGGQNGVKSIISLCGTENFPRIKIGIGNKPNDMWRLEDWVVSSFSDDEFKTVTENFENVFKAIKLIIDGKIDEAMSNYN